VVAASIWMRLVGNGGSSGMRAIDSLRFFDNSLRSFFIAGFECSSHMRSDGVRLDLVASTHHDRLVKRDYEQIQAYGIHTARDGLRWHHIEFRPNQYCWDSWLPMLRASRAAGIQVIWDLCHYGWPDDLDIWSPEFVDRFARYSRAAAQLIRNETDEAPHFCPINEISYWAWAGAEVGRMNPATLGRGAELKRQLVRAFIASVDAIRAVDSRAKFITAEPLINVVSDGRASEQLAIADIYRRAQFETQDMLLGHEAPELGGKPDNIDCVGLNFYPENQWYVNGKTIPLGHHAYRSLHAMLAEVHHRYRKPLLISETGAEGSARPYWLHHICAEVARAIRCGIPIEGVCLYPILDYHGWDNDRVCRVGLLSMPDVVDVREEDPEFARELIRQTSILNVESRRKLRLVV
jgi:hypothetical protein